MRHRVKMNKLSRPASHRNALVKNLARNVFESGSIITTSAKAKVAQSLVERVLSKAKEASTTADASRKMALSRDINRNFHDSKLTAKIVNELAPKYSNKVSGFTRVLKIGFRRGDAAELSLLQLIPTEEK